jgi:hypothetical protein
MEYGDQAEAMDSASAKRGTKESQDQTLKKNNYLNEPDADHLDADDDYEEFLTDLPDIENTQSHRQEHVNVIS